MREKKLYKLAFALAFFTIIYNVGEGFLATYLGYEEKSLTLLGFGIDSFVEVISGFGIVYMILRIQRNPNSKRDKFEKTALFITGYSFYAITIGLIFTGIYNIYTKHKPETTLWGIAISIVSIIIMYLLIVGKTKAGKKLNSEAILADAECTKVCIYMSIILLISSIVYQLTSFYYIDSLGALTLSYFTYNEGKECFAKAKSNKYCSCEHD